MKATSAVKAPIQHCASTADLKRCSSKKQKIDASGLKRAWNRFSRPYGTPLFFPPFPALKRGAITATPFRGWLTEGTSCRHLQEPVLMRSEECCSRQNTDANRDVPTVCFSEDPGPGIWRGSIHLIRAMVLTGLTAGVFLAVGCSKDKPEEPTVNVQAKAVETKALERTVTADAILFPLQQSAIVPKISAPVKKFYVKRGSRVRKGQLLAVLENSDLAAAAQENRGAYDQAQAAYATTTAASLPEEIQKAQLDVQVAKEALDAAQKVYDSRQSLFNQGALPRRDLDQASVNLVQARSQYDISQKHLNSVLAVGKKQELKSAAGQLESAQGKYQGAQAQLSYSEIRSPIDGAVTDRPLYAGEMPAGGAPLITVMDLSQVIARAHIPQDEAALLKVGDKATITSPNEKPVNGSVTVVSPALDPNSTTVEIWVQAKNPGERLKPGSSVKLTMAVETIPSALVVPAAALLTAPDGSTSVMVVGTDGRAHQKNVKLGIKQGEEVQIAEGLDAGEKVVTTGAYGLPDNVKVSIEVAKESAEGPAKRSAGKEPDKDDK